MNFELRLFANQVSRVSRRLGINPDDIGNTNRRQGVQSSFVAKGLSGMMGVAKSIPVDMVMQLVFVENNFELVACLDIDDNSHKLVEKSELDYLFLARWISWQMQRTFLIEKERYTLMLAQQQ